MSKGLETFVKIKSENIENRATFEIKPKKIKNGKKLRIAAPNNNLNASNPDAMLNLFRV